MENQTPEVVVPQQSKLNPMLWVVIGVAILAAGVGIGLAAGKYFQPVSSTTSVSIVPSTPILSPTVAPVEKDDPTANWKTYTNEDYGFSFSYPDELTYLYDHLKGGNILLQNFDGSSPRKELDSDFQMVITANDTNGKLLEDYPKQWETELGKLPTETISVGGITAIKGFSGQKYQAVPTVWFSKNATTFMIQLSHPKSTNKIWFDQILSTFKFIEPVASPAPQISYVKPEISDTSSWKLYTLKNIQFKAPGEARVSITDGDAVITLPESVMPSANIMLRTYNGGSRREWWIKEINATSGEVSKYMRFQDVMLDKVAALDVFGDGGWWQGGYASPILIAKGKTIIAIHGGRGLNPETGKTSRSIFSDSVASTIKFIQ